MWRSKPVSLAAGLILSSLLLSACTQRVGDFTLISTKNVDFSKPVVDYKGSRRVSESDCAPTVLIFPLGRPDLKEAVDRALESGRGNLMIDQVSYYRHWYIPLLYGERCMVAEGTVVDVARQSE